MAKVRLVSWNVNGLVGGDRFELFCTYLEFLGYPDFVLLQETHSNNRKLIDRWEEFLSNYICYFGHGDGRNKGTAILVNKRTQFYMSLNGLVQDLNGRFTIIKGLLGNRLVTICSVYAPVEKVERSGFLSRLLGYNMEGVLYIMGDYNSVINMALDRTYSRTRTREDVELQDFMQKSDTVDVWRYLHGNDIEYSYIHPVSSSRIDLALVSSDVICEFKKADYIPNFSDHKLLEVETEMGVQLIGNDFIKIKPHVVTSEQFTDNFKDFWWEQERVFYNTIINKIRDGTFNGCLGEAVTLIEQGMGLKDKVFLDNLKIDGKWWDKFKKRVLLCGKIVGKRLAKQNNLEYKKLLREYYLVAEGSREKGVLAKKLKDIVTSVNKENAFKAQINDRISFEKCSAPFFTSIKKRRKALYIGKIRNNDGIMIEGRESIEGFLVNCYEELYSEKESDFTMHENFLTGLPVIQDDILGQDIDNFISTSEIAEAIAQAKNGKCPGVDGIPIEFYKKYSGLLLPYLTKLFNNCMVSGVFPESWGKGIIKLIPKKEDAELSFNNLRPLTMGNVDRKLYAKVWYSRLIKTSDAIINKSQTGGVPGRSIQGSTLLLHLLISYYGEKGLEGYIMSLDNAKAFDTIIRIYLWTVMAAFGYSQFTIRNIKKLYDNTTANICINGFFTQAIVLKSGVIQGCPLSGLLYVISGEPLARAIHREVEVKGFRLPNQQEVKMIQHVDDATYILANQCSIIQVLNIVGDYSKVCGTVINMDKSFIIKIGQSRLVVENNRLDFQGIKVLSQNEDHGCKKILGILFSAVPITYIDKNFLEVTKKCQNIMDIWNDRNLSLVGRVLVVNALVVPKLVYLLQTLDITKRRLNFLRERISRFIWSGMGCKHKLSILEWGRERGGLGLVPVDLKARALRLKTLKDYLGKGENGRDGGPVIQILAYFMDITVRVRFYRELEDMHQLLQDPITGGGILARRNNKDHHLKYYIEDVKTLWEYEQKNYDISRWDSIFYFKKMVADRAEGEQNIMKREISTNRIHFFRQYFSEREEKKIWKEVFHKGLDPKVKAFNFKLVHNLLPIFDRIGGDNKNCRFCIVKEGRNVRENVEHAFIECKVAKGVWDNFNIALRSQGVRVIDCDRETIIYKLGLDEWQSLLVSEVNWALWKNRNNNIKNNVGNNYGGVSVVIKMVIARIGKLTKVDRVLMTSAKYRLRWGVIEGILQYILRQIDEDDA